MSETKFTCCICGKEVKEYGNDPWPIKKEGRCCSYCNWTVVLRERNRLSKLNREKENGTGSD